MPNESPKDPTRSSQRVTADFSDLKETKADSVSTHAGSMATGRRGDAAPRKIASYEILAELGRGGMGVVYHGHDLRLKRDVAIKVVLAGGHAGKVEFARFQTEAEAVARLKHPHVVQVYEIGEEHGLPFLALEYCAGGSLDDRLNESPPSFRESAELVAALAEAVEHAHLAGIIHRDLKPANVLFDADGTPKLTDFGLAKFIGDDDSYTRTGSVLGSAAYMSPEQASGNTREVTPAADTYALGAILYRLLAGRTVFEGGSDLETIQMIVSDVPIPVRKLRPACPRDLETICLKCLEKNPDDRYASAGAFAADLGHFLRGDPIHARAATPLEQLLSWTRRNPLPTSIVVLSVLMLATLASILAWMSYRNYRVLEAIQARDMRVEELRGQILYLDEVLTGSALVASLTGDTYWDERYRRYEPALAAALDEAISLVPDSQADLAAVQSANDSLVALESRALELVRRGEHEEARALIDGDEYAAYKRSYSAGLGRFAERLKQHSAAAVAAARREATMFLTAAVMLGAIVLLIFLLAGYALLRVISYRVAPAPATPTRFQQSDQTLT